MMAFVLALALALILAFDRIVNSISKNPLPWYASPTAWFILPWIGSSLLLAFPIFDHQEELRAEHIIYIVICFVGFASGCQFKYFTTTSFSKSASIKLRTESNTAFLVVAGLGLAGHAAALYDSLQTSGISLAERFTSKGLSSARAALFEGQATGMTGTLSMFEPLTAFSFVACTFFLVDLSVQSDRAKQKWARNVALLSAGLIVFNALLVTGGRMNLLLLTMTVVAVFCLDSRQLFWRHFSQMKRTTRSLLLTFGSVVALTVVVLLGSVFAEARMDGVSPDFLLSQSHRASINPVVSELIGDSKTARFGLFTLSYFTVPIPTLVYFLDLPEHSFPGPFWGQYNFPGFSDNVMRRTGTDLYIGWVAARSQVFGALMLQGYGGNVWSTFIRDLAVDFSKWGVPVFLFFFGWLCQTLTYQARRDNSPYIIGAAAATLVIIGYSILHSLFYIQTAWGLLYYSLLAYFIKSVLDKFSYKARPVK